MCPQTEPTFFKFLLERYTPKEEKMSATGGFPVNMQSVMQTNPSLSTATGSSQTDVLYDSMFGKKPYEITTTPYDMMGRENFNYVDILSNSKK